MIYENGLWELEDVRHHKTELNLEIKKLFKFGISWKQE